MSLALQLKDYRLTTAEILYRLPDHPGILQSYIWQELDLAPRFPVLHRFLDFWHRELDGKVHSVRVASAKLIKPAVVSQPGSVSPAALKDTRAGMDGRAMGFATLNPSYETTTPRYAIAQDGVRPPYPWLRPTPI